MTNWGRGLLVPAGGIAGAIAFVQPSWADRDDRRYPAPVYPYPNPYEPPVAVIVPPAPQKPAPPPPPPQNWYYCELAQGYYPYVPACPGGWRAVPATPGTAPSMPERAPPAPPPGATQ